MILPKPDCDLCPRLSEFRACNKRSFPNEFNALVPPFGAEDAKLLIVGLAPGLRGANFTGRPFTGDYAGDLLYATLLKFGLARGEYQERADDGLELVQTRITNAVRCVPPENKPTPEEINTCRSFLESEIKNLKNLKVIVCLGLISHNAVLKTLRAKPSEHKFTHGAHHKIGNLHVVDSYHCSRYNTNTGRLTAQMFEGVFQSVLPLLSTKD